MLGLLVEKLVKIGHEFQVAAGSAAKVNSPNYSIVTHQTEVTAGVTDKAINIAKTDTIDVRKSFVEIDGVR